MVRKQTNQQQKQHNHLQPGHIKILQVRGKNGKDVLPTISPASVSRGR